LSKPTDATRFGHARAGDDETQLLADVADLCDLLERHEHAFDLGCLIGAAHPALDPHIGAPAATLAGHKREVNPAMMEVKRGHDDLADIGIDDGIAGCAIQFPPSGFVGTTPRWLL
jgi:hypothetical protein